MTHRTFARFWKRYEQLSQEIKDLADKNYELLTNDPFHPSLHFKSLGGRRQLWSVRVGDSYRALAIKQEENVYAWFWIGPHAEYDRLISQ